MKGLQGSSIPSGWQSRRFGDCARLINGRAYLQHELLDSGTPVLRIQNLNGGDRWYYSDLNLPDEKYCVAGDLLYAWSASFGPYRFMGKKSIFHYHIWRVIPGDDLDKDYAFRLLEQITREVKSAAHGVAMLHMTKSGMEAWPIPLPPLPEQRRIAKILDKADELRAKRRAALAELDALTQSIFLEMFGDPAANPRGWPIVSLSAVCDMITGYPFRSNEYVGGVNAIRLCRGANILPGRIDWSDLVSWPESKLPQFEEFRLVSGDIVIAMDRPWIAEGFKIAMVIPENCPSLLVQRVARLRGTNGVSNRFLFHLLGQPAFTRHCRPTETTVPHISPKDIRSFKFPLPPKEFQAEFSRRVLTVEKLKSSQRASLTELDALFASLQHRAFRGELFESEAAAVLASS